MVVKHTIRELGLTVAIALVLVLVACAGSEGEKGIPVERGLQGDTPAPTGTPYPTLTTSPIQTPYGVAPTYTPHPTYTPLPTGTPYPAQTALATQTPYGVAPTLTPRPTLTPVPTGTPYPAQTALATQTPYRVAPTLTPQPTYTPLPTGTPYPTQTALPTQAPYRVAPTLTPQPTYTPYPTSTPQPTPTPFPTLRPTPMPTPQPLLSRLHDTQNTRWLARNYPGIAQQIQAFPWVRDGLSDLEARAIDEILYLGVGKIDNLRAVLRLPWLQDAITDTEYDIMDWLSALDYRDADAASEVIAMPFLEAPDATDALAIWAMHDLAAEGVLDHLVATVLFQDGITDTDTTLVAALGTLHEDAEFMQILLFTSSVESVAAGTDLTPELKISIVRIGPPSQSRPGTLEAVQEGVAFVERTIQAPLPVEHVIVVLATSAIAPGYAGTNHGFAFSYSPEYETQQGTYGWKALQSGFVHEVAHYYWRGHADWIDEGVANTLEYMYGIGNGLSRGQLLTKRKNCEAHDLEMLTLWNPALNNSAFLCNYYLGEQLFLELLEALGRQEFTALLQDLYRVALPVREAGGTPGIAEVRQVFAGQRAIVDKHWSGALNAPENRPFDEGVERTSHDLVQWDQHPVYDGHTVTFSGTLLDGAVLSSETIGQARAGGYSNFNLSIADIQEYVGSILPPLPGGSSWILDDPGDSVASTYALDAAAKSFTVTFPFPEALATPSDYVVIVWGF